MSEDLSTPDSPPKARNWWFSADGKRGFNWNALTAYDYRPGSDGMKATLYLYVQGGIVHLNGTEAESIYPMVVEKVATKTAKEKGRT